MSLNENKTASHENICAECEGRGFLGTAYWDDELDWFIFGKDGKSCEYCEGSGIGVSALPKTTAECLSAS